jgi:SAM-dependent methyltransferase
MTGTVEIDESRLQEFTDQVFGDLAACYGGVMVTLGERLGLYEALHGAGPLTSAEVAARSGCAERYVREWLNAQAAAGYLTRNGNGDAGTYELPPEHAAVLADPESAVLMTPAFNVPASMWLDEEQAVEAFRTGAGVPWSAHDERLFCGVAGFFRNAYKGTLVPQWLPALDGVVEKLKAGATVADVGCGHGHSIVLMAEAFPNARFHGFDNHSESIAAARRIVDEAGVGDRVELTDGDATDLGEERFDLICFFDALHDMGNPTGAAQAARNALADGGTVMLVEPQAADSSAENVGPIARLYYSASTTLCTAHARSEGAEDPLGAQAGEARLREVFANAGFGHWRRATETPFNLVLEARAG